MRDDVCADLFKCPYCFSIFGRLIAAVNEFCRLITCGLKAELNKQRHLSCLSCKDFQYLRAKAVRSCRNRDCFNAISGRSFREGFFENIRKTVCICKALEIGYVSCIISGLSPDLTDRSFYLRRYRTAGSGELARTAFRTEDASARAFAPVPVGAGHIHGYRCFVHLMSERVTEILICGDHQKPSSGWKGSLTILSALFSFDADSASAALLITPVP